MHTHTHTHTHTLIHSSLIHTHTGTLTASWRAKRIGVGFALVCREDRMVRRRLVICSLDSSGMPLGNGLVLSDLTLKPSFLEAPEHPEFFSIRTEKVSGTQPSLYSLQGAGDSAPALPISVSFPLIPAQIEKNTRNSCSSQLYKSLLTHWLMV